MSAATVRVATTRCIVCREPGTVVVPVAGFQRWVAGAHAQDAFPALSAGEREQLITGTHPACWDDIFTDDEEDQDK